MKGALQTRIALCGLYGKRYIIALCGLYAKSTSVFWEGLDACMKAAAALPYLQLMQTVEFL